MTQFFCCSIEEWLEMIRQGFCDGMLEQLKSRRFCRLRLLIVAHSDDLAGMVFRSADRLFDVPRLEAAGWDLKAYLTTLIHFMAGEIESAVTDSEQGERYANATLKKAFFLFVRETSDALQVLEEHERRTVLPCLRHKAARQWRDPACAAMAA